MADNARPRYECSHEVRRSGNDKLIIMKCSQCSDPGDFFRPECRMGIISAISNEYNITGIELEEALVKRFQNTAFEVIKMLGNLYRIIESSANRMPPLQGRTKGGVTCQSCPMNPRSIFLPMEKIIASDISKLYSSVFDIAKKLKIARGKSAECNRCIDATKDDIVAVFNTLEQIRSEVLYHGYRIVSMEG